MHRLQVTPEALGSESIALSGASAQHLKVLRPKPGELVELFDGEGCARVYSCGATASSPLSAAGDIMRFPKPACGITLFACITKGSRWDWTIEKATELGVSRIVPVISDRCIVRIARSDRSAKRERWVRIAEDAARQSDAKWLPEISEAVDFRDSIPLVKECVCFVGALMEPRPEPIFDAVSRLKLKGNGCSRQFALYVGPEGDFTADELNELLDVAIPASFGPTVLRAETAAIFGVSVLSAALR